METNLQKARNIFKMCHAPVCSMKNILRCSGQDLWKFKKDMNIFLKALLWIGTLFKFWSGSTTLLQCYFNQCCGSRSVCFWASRIRIHYYKVPTDLDPIMQKLFLDAILKVTDENSRTRSRIRSLVRIRGSGSVLKCTIWNALEYRMSLA